MSGTIAVRGGTFVISIVLARILSPEEFGLVGMVMVFVIIANGLMDVGLGSALIQKQDTEEEDWSSVFYLNVVMGMLICATVYLGSDLLGDFYENPEIPPITRVLSLVFVINSVAIIHKTRLRKTLGFRKLTIVSIIASISSGCVGILLAINGFGVWSLVYQVMVNYLLTTILFWVGSEWYPRLFFSMKRIRSLWNFGFSVFITESINNAIRRLDVLMIGKMYSPGLLGYYTRAQSVDSMVKVIGSQSIMRVFFPSLSQIQHDTKKLIETYTKLMSVLSMISLGLVGLLYVSSESLFITLFTAKWESSIPIFQIMVLKSFVPTISALQINVLKARGNANDLLKAEFIKKGMYLIAVFVGLRYGIFEFLVAAFIQALFSLFVNFMFIKKELNINFQTHLRAMAPYGLYAFIAGMVTNYILNLGSLSPLGELLSSFVLFLTLFLGFLVAFKDQSLKTVVTELTQLALKKTST